MEVKKIIIIFNALLLFPETSLMDMTAHDRLRRYAQFKSCLLRAKRKIFISHILRENNMVIKPDLSEYLQRDERFPCLATGSLEAMYPCS